MRVSVNDSEGEEKNGEEKNGEEAAFDIIGLWARGLGNPWVS